jgi:hypothetical protein
MKKITGMRHLQATELCEDAIRRFYREPAFQKLVLDVIDESRKRGSGLGRALEATIFAHKYLNRKLGLTEQMVVRSA